MKRKILSIIIAIAVLAVAIAAGLLYLSGEDDGTRPVYYTTIAPSQMKIALSTGQISGYIAWEPFGSDAVVGGIGKDLFWSEEIRPDHPCCVVLVSRSFLTSDDGIELTKRFVRAHMDATDWMKDVLADKEGENYTKLIEMGVEFTQRNASVVSAAFEHLKFDYSISEDFIDAMAWYTESFMEIDLITESALQSRGYSSPMDFAQQYTNTSFLELAQEVEPSDTILGEVRLGFLVGDLHQMAQVVALNSSIFGDESLFERYGLSVTPAAGSPYANGPMQMDNFAQGNVDIGYLGAPPAILKHINHPGVQAVIVAQANSEGSALIVSHDIQSLDDLRGKKVAIPGVGTIQYLLLQMLLRDAGIAIKAA